MVERAARTNTGCGPARAARLAAVLTILVAAAAAGPTGIDNGGLAFKEALARDQNDNGSRSGGRTDNGSAPVQKADRLDDNDADPADAIAAEGAADPLSVDQQPTDSRTVPMNIQVIEEIAGLPDESSLSEEEELEAIRSGWDTWRTADGPNSRTVQ